jgi:hypothetical protein
MIGMGYPVRLWGKLGTFGRLSGAERWLALEAVVMLGLAQFVLLIVPFRHIAAGLRRMPETAVHDRELNRRVREAVTLAARNMPWNAVCLPRAITAKMMLARRGCGSAVHFGATLGKDGKIDAHAWLTAGGEIVVGAAGIAGMAPLARFG